LLARIFMKLGRVRRLVSGFVDGIGIGIAFRICFFVSIGFVSPVARGAID